MTDDLQTKLGKFLDTQIWGTNYYLAGAILKFMEEEYDRQLEIECGKLRMSLKAKGEDPDVS